VDKIRAALPVVRIFLVRAECGESARQYVHHADLSRFIGNHTVR